MDKKILLAIAFAFVFIAFFSFSVHAEAATNGNCTKYANYSMNAAGNRTWIIANGTASDPVLCAKVTIDNITNITIRNGGYLYLQEVNITFNGSSALTLGIAVESGGTLNIDNGSHIFSANGTELGYNFYFYSGSAGFINNSSISGLQNFSGSNGINIQSSSVEITNITINNSLGYAINISGASPLIKNSSLFNNSGGIYAKSSSATIANVTITNSTTGINASSSPLNVTNSTFTLNTLYGIFLENSNAIIRNNTLNNNTAGIFSNNSNPTIDKNLIQHSLTNNSAAVFGINISNSNSATLSNNTLINNTFGIVFWNSNLTVGDFVINKSAYGVFLQNKSVVTMFNSIINNTVPNGRPYGSAIYFNITSGPANLTIINVTYDNVTFDGNSSSLASNTSLTVKWYIDMYTGVNSTFAPVSEVSANLSNTTIWFRGVSNASGTFPRLNLTEAIIWQNQTNLATITANYSNYTFNGSKGNVSASNSTLLTANRVGLSNLSITLSLSRVSLQVNGAGTAAGYTVQNGNVTFTNGSTVFNATTGSSGSAVAYIPIGYYNLSVSQANFSGRFAPFNSTLLNISEGANYSTTVTMTMFPRINISGNGTTNAYKYAITQDGSRTNTTINDSDNNVPAGSQVAFIGTTIYAHNGAAANGTTVYVSSSTSSFVSTAFTNLSLSGAFNIPFTAPSPTSVTNYTDISVLVNDSYGDIGNVTEWLRVAAASTSNGSSSTTSGGGGGSGGGAGDYGLMITEYDKQIIVAQGATKKVNVVVKNIGLKALSKVGLTLSGITSSWYKVNTSTGQSTVDLSPDKAATFSVTISIPSSATPMAYRAAWRARDANALTLAEKDLNLTVSQVWSSTRVATINTSLAELETQLNDLWKNITILKQGGVNVTEVIKNFNALNDTLKLARSEYETGDYDAAQEDINRIKADMPTFLSLVAGAKPQGVAQVLGTALAKPLGKIMLIAVVAVAVAGGLFLWWRFLRVHNITEIKKAPRQFEQGSRIQGVIKSVTETKKGKVFLIADASGEKLHVRYPYYTTVEVGDLIRVSGVIKTYKDVPYMDATELHRVTGKPSG